MKIGELSHRTGLSTSKIRFYESIGLLRDVERGRNGYRSYPPEAVTALGLIAAAQSVGFTLDEIRALLPEDGLTWEHETVVGSLRLKIAEIDAMQIRLSQVRKNLCAVIGDIEQRPEDIDCAANAGRIFGNILQITEPEAVPTKKMPGQIS